MAPFHPLWVVGQLLPVVPPISVSSGGQMSERDAGRQSSTELLTAAESGHREGEARPTRGSRLMVAAGCFLSATSMRCCSNS